MTKNLGIVSYTRNVYAFVKYTYHNFYIVRGAVIKQ